MKLSLRTWLSIATFGLIVLLIVLTRHELLHAWRLMSQVNLWILAIFIPLVLVNYFATGEMIFSYLRGKKRIGHISPFEQIRMSLEMNFVNHVLPSGGASGVSYMTWRLGKLGVPASHAMMAQAVRFTMGFAGFSVLLIISVLAVTIDSGINRSMILLSSMLVGTMIAVTAAGIYFLKDLRRVNRASAWITKVGNGLVRRVTFGRKRAVINEQTFTNFMVEMHHDYLELKRDRKVLWKPFIWSIIFNITDIAMFFVVFWALGSIVNPAAILIGYGIGMIAGFAVVTPGGSGAYEALMAGSLVISGVSQGVAIAGVVLARVLILMVILVIGYVFYQYALVRYGKREPANIQRQ